jgi:hypothetical protein
MYVRGVKLTGKVHLKQALDDIFEWDENYRLMILPRKSKYDLDAEKLRQTEDSIEAEVAFMLG